MKNLSRTIYRNGKIVTMDANDTMAHAVLVSNGRIEAVGEEHELLSSAGPQVEQIDLGGHTLYPGFIDSHSHLSLYSAWKQYVYCGGVSKLDEALHKLAMYAKSNPSLPFIVGYGFDDTDIPEQRGPNVHELDEVCSDRPTLIIHISVHAAYLNTKMFKVLGIPLDTPSSDLNVICQNGLPTGVQ